jgi:hypothetical protein
MSVAAKEQSGRLPVLRTQEGVRLFWRTDCEGVDVEPSTVKMDERFREGLPT